MRPPNMEKSLNTQVSPYPVAHQRNTPSQCTSCPTPRLQGCAYLEVPSSEKQCIPNWRGRHRGWQQQIRLAQTTNHHGCTPLAAGCCSPRAPCPWGCPGPNSQRRSG